jgi:hypothetical protein
MLEPIYCIVGAGNSIGLRSNILLELFCLLKKVSFVGRRQHSLASGSQSYCTLEVTTMQMLDSSMYLAHRSI